MTHDITEYDENKQIENKQIENRHIEDGSAPPLCLVHYFAERAAYAPERIPKPPGGRRVGRVAERRGNLIVLEFAPPPAPKAAQTERRDKGFPARAYDALVILLLLACLLGCLAAFRF